MMLSYVLLGMMLSYVLLGMMLSYSDFIAFFGIQPVPFEFGNKSQ